VKKVEVVTGLIDDQGGHLILSSHRKDARLGDVLGADLGN
jgi:hypothetical protein